MLLESLRLQVESSVLETSIPLVSIYLVGWEPSNISPSSSSGLKTPIQSLLELCPLASVTLDSTSHYAMARQYDEDCGANKGFPKNPYLQIFTNYINHLPNIQAVVYDHTGTFTDDKNMSLVYNDYGFIHSLEINDKGRFYLGQRRKDIELYHAFSKQEIQRRRAANDPDLPCPKEWDDLLSAVLDPTIRAPSPEQPASPKSQQSSDSAQTDNKALRALDIPTQLKNSPIETNLHR